MEEDISRHHNHRRRRDNLNGQNNSRGRHSSRRISSNGPGAFARVDAADAHRIARQVGTRSRYIFFGAFERVFDEKKVRWKIVPRYKRIAVLLSAGLALFWILTAIAVWCGYKYIKRYDEISFVKVALLPFYISEHRKDMGEYNIRKGYEAIKEKDPSKAFQYLYKGVVQSPDNLEARITLAQIYLFGLKDPTYAATILNDRLELAVKEKNKAYLKAALTMFMASADYTDAFAETSKRLVASGILKESDITAIATPVIKSMHAAKNDAELSNILEKILSKFESPNLSKFFASNLSVAYVSIGDFVSAWNVLNKYGITDTSVGEEISCRIMWQKCDELKALALARNIAKNRRNSENAYSMLVEFYKELGDDEMLRISEDAKALISNDLFASKMLQIERAKDDAERNKNIDEYFKTFSGSAAAIAKLASYAVKTRDAILMDRCIKIDFKNERLNNYIRLINVEFLLVARKIDAAMEELLVLSYSMKENPVQKDLLEGMQITTDAMSGKNVDADIRSFVLSNNSKPASIINLANFFMRCGLYNEAELLCELSEKNFPADYRFKNILAKIYLSRGDFPSLALLAVRTRVPIPELLAVESFALSDASAFIPAEKRAILIKKIEHAKEVRRKSRLMPAK